VDGINGEAREFNSEDAEINYGDGASINFTGAGTITMLVYPYTLATDSGVMLQKYSSGESLGIFSQHEQSSGADRFRIDGNNGAGYKVLGGTNESSPENNTYLYSAK